MTLPQQKLRGERSRRQKFSRWLAAQAHRDDDIGHFALETLSGAERLGVSHEAYLTRLNLADGDVPQARDALFEAIVEWGGSGL